MYTLIQNFHFLQCGLGLLGNNTKTNVWDAICGIYSHPVTAVEIKVMVNKQPQYSHWTRGNTWIQEQPSRKHVALVHSRRMLKGCLVSEWLWGNPIPNTVLTGKMPVIMHFRVDLSRGRTHAQHTPVNYMTNLGYFVLFYLFPLFLCSWWLAEEGSCRDDGSHIVPQGVFSSVRISCCLK